MPYQEGATPLASLCQKAGSTLGEVLALDEDELEELSKEIVGNGVLEHARVIRQWRRCRVEERLRKELEVELTNEGQGVEVPLLGIDAPQKRVRYANDVLQKPVNDFRENQGNHITPEKQDEVIGESWQQYLRKQIRVEMEEIEPPPVTSVVTSRRTSATSAFTEEDDGDEYETFMESITLDPSLQSSEEEDLKTSYNPVNAVGAVASDMMEYIEDGISAFFEPEIVKQKKSKSLLETGMEYFYLEEPVRKKKDTRKKKKEQPQSFLEEGMRCFYDDSGANKENNKQKKSKKKTLSRSFENRRKKQRDQGQPGETFKLVPTRSLQARHKFHC